MPLPETIVKMSIMFRRNSSLRSLASISSPSEAEPKPNLRRISHSRTKSWLGKLGSWKQDDSHVDDLPGRVASTSEASVHKPRRVESADNSFFRLVVNRLEQLTIQGSVEDAREHHFEGPAIDMSLCSFVERVIRGMNNYAEETLTIESTGIRCSVIAIEFLERTRLRFRQEDLPRLFLIAFMLAYKVSDDFCVETGWWAFLLGCEERAVNEMELSLCQLIGWDVSIPENAYRSQQRLMFSSNLLEH